MKYPFAPHRRSSSYMYFSASEMRQQLIMTPTRRPIRNPATDAQTIDSQIAAPSAPLSVFPTRGTAATA